MTHLGEELARRHRKCTLPDFVAPEHGRKEASVYEHSVGIYAQLYNIHLSAFYYVCSWEVLSESSADWTSCPNPTARLPRA